MKKAIDALREYHKYYKASQAIDNLQNETIIEHADRLDALEGKKAEPALDALVEAVKQLLSEAYHDKAVNCRLTQYIISVRNFNDLEQALSAYEAAKEE